jgi:hypothetical protein
VNFSRFLCVFAPLREALIVDGFTVLVTKSSPFGSGQRPGCEIRGQLPGNPRSDQVARKLCHKRSEYWRLAGKKTSAFVEPGIAACGQN